MVEPGAGSRDPGLRCEIGLYRIVMIFLASDFLIEELLSPLFVKLCLAL